MSMATKTATPAVYSREPGGVFTPAAALHKIIDDLGSATPWAMLAFGLAPRPARVKTVPRAGQPFHAGPLSRRETMPGGEASPRPPQSVVSAARDSWVSTRGTDDDGGLGEASLPGMHEDVSPHANIPFRAGTHSHRDSHARAFAKKSAPLNYSVRYQTAPPAPAGAMTSGGRG
jgi:hypothetical protein